VPVCGPVSRATGGPRSGRPRRSDPRTPAHEGASLADNPPVFTDGALALALDDYAAEPAPADVLLFPKNRVKAIFAESEECIGGKVLDFPGGVWGKRSGCGRFTSGTTVYVDGDPVNMYDPTGHNGLTINGNGCIMTDCTAGSPSPVTGPTTTNTGGGDVHTGPSSTNRGGGDVHTGPSSTYTGTCRDCAPIKTGGHDGGGGHHPDPPTTVLSTPVHVGGSTANIPASTLDDPQGWVSSPSLPPNSFVDANGGLEFDSGPTSDCLMVYCGGGVDSPTNLTPDGYSLLMQYAAEVQAGEQAQEAVEAYEAEAAHFENGCGWGCAFAALGTVALIVGGAACIAATDGFCGAVVVPFLAGGGAATAEQVVNDDGPDAADTAAGGTSVFWSGGEAAKTAATEWASANGGATIGMTEAGQSVEAATQGMEWSEARPLWEAASRDFASNASGEVKVFQSASGVNITSIWAQTEYPTLLANPNVSAIDYLTVGAEP